MLAAVQRRPGRTGSRRLSSVSGDRQAKVGVILPGRGVLAALGEQRPARLLKKAIDAAGIDADIQNATKDVTKFGTICDAMINEGVTVLMIVNLDSDSGAACLKKAQAAGIPSIDYDRLTLGGRRELLRVLRQRRRSAS